MTREYQDYRGKRRAKRRHDPEYLKVEKRLKPWLDFLDFLFRIKMSLRKIVKLFRQDQEGDQ